MKSTVLLCDLHDGTQLAVAGVRVEVNGSHRRLDVCGEHLALLEALPLHDDGAGSPTGASPSASPSQGRKITGSRRHLQQERAAAREWARSRGLDVADRGRLPDGLLDEYRRSTTH